MSTSSVNNGSQANSEIEVAAAVAPQVHFAEEALVVAGSSSNPDGDHRHRRRHGQRATRRFQRATSVEVEFSNEFTVSLHISLFVERVLTIVLGGKGFLRPLPFGAKFVRKG